MGYTGDFFDNVTYGADNINAIRKTVFSPGVLPDSGDSCKVISNESGGVKILPGEAIFDDGSRIEIDTEGESLSLTSGQTNYVYLKRDTIQNTALPVISTTQPTGNNVIMLATVASSGAITDTRAYAMLRVANVAQPEHFSGSESISGTLAAGASVVKTIVLPATCKKVKFIVDGKNLFAETALPGQGMSYMITESVYYSTTITTDLYISNNIHSTARTSSTRPDLDTFIAYKAFDSYGYCELTKCEMQAGKLLLTFHNATSKETANLSATICWEAW